MIEARSFAGKGVAVFGLGRSGLAAVRALAAGGADVRAWDDGADARRAAEQAGIGLTDLYADDWAGVTALVLSPGIPLTHPEPHPLAVKAHRCGVEIIGDVEILARTQTEASYIGITGTNGKSTTTVLLGHILKQAGRTIEVGGNLGTPALSFQPLGADGAYVLEMSSYQLDLTPTLVFDIAVMLNVSPDHLDRHGGMAGYVAAKKRIFKGQSGADATAIIGVDDVETRAVHDAIKAEGARRVIPVSALGAVEGGVYVLDGHLVDASEGMARRVVDLGEIPTLPGVHNAQNAAAAYAAARAAGVDVPDIVRGLRTYPGLAHRQEVIATLKGVTYINDSKATNADAAARALACYDTIYWIVGGRPKAGGLAGLSPYFPRIRHAFLIGEAAPAFAADLEGHVPYTQSGTLADAFAAARAMAEADGAKGAVVLLSPAAASFDQFRDFEDRGNTFRALVQGKGGAV